MHYLHLFTQTTVSHRNTVLPNKPSLSSVNTKIKNIGCSDMNTNLFFFGLNIVIKWYDSKGHFFPVMQYIFIGHEVWDNFFNQSFNFFNQFTILVWVDVAIFASLNLLSILLKCFKQITFSSCYCLICNLPI